MTNPLDQVGDKEPSLDASTAGAPGGPARFNYWYFYDFEARGAFTLTVEVPWLDAIIEKGSQVAASITELTTDPLHAPKPMMGDAYMSVDNVVPDPHVNNSLAVRGRVQFGTLLPVRLNFIIAT
jgi:hypothetical protein